MPLDFVSLIFFPHTLRLFWNYVVGWNVGAISSGCLQQLCQRQYMKNRSRRKLGCHLVFSQVEAFTRFETQAGIRSVSRIPYRYRNWIFMVAAPKMVERSTSTEIRSPFPPFFEGQINFEGPAANTSLHSHWCRSIVSARDILKLNSRATFKVGQAYLVCVLHHFTYSRDSITFPMKNLQSPKYLTFPRVLSIISWEFCDALALSINYLTVNMTWIKEDISSPNHEQDRFSIRSFLISCLATSLGRHLRPEAFALRVLEVCRSAVPPTRRLNSLEGPVWLRPPRPDILLPSV